MWWWRPAMSNTPSDTSFKLSISAPSSRSVVDVGGIEPGRIPPMSAWCPREAVKKMISCLPCALDAGENTGVMIVMSGR
jgi:hypothetical protein